MILNGTESGQNRVSSANVWLNGQVIASPSDFNQNVFQIEKSVGEGLVPSQNLLAVSLRSSPGSFLTIKIIDGDTTPPVLSLNFPPSDPWWVNVPDVVIQGTVNDPAAGIKINSLPSIIPSPLVGEGGGEGAYSFSASVSLLEGENFITVKATDPCGNSSFISLTVFYLPVLALSVIGPEGGSVEITDPASPIYGASITVPPGALVEQTPIFLNSPTRSFPEPQTGVSRVGPGVEFGVEGVIFSIPAVIGLPYDEALVAETGFLEELITVVFYDELTGLYEEVPALFVDVQKNIVYAEIGHFSSTGFPATVDKSPPVITCFSPPPVVNLPDINIRIKANDTGGCAVSHSPLKLNLSKNSGGGGGGGNWPSYPWPYDWIVPFNLDVHGGTTNINIYATIQDCTGNKSGIILGTTIFDKTPPSLTITSPAQTDVIYTNVGTATISGMVSDALSKVTFYINQGLISPEAAGWPGWSGWQVGQVWTGGQTGPACGSGGGGGGQGPGKLFCSRSNTCTFSKQFNLSLGLNSFTFEARDEANNPTVVTKQIFYDTTPPSVSLDVGSPQCPKVDDFHFVSSARLPPLFISNVSLLELMDLDGDDDLDLLVGSEGGDPSLWPLINDEGGYFTLDRAVLIRSFLQTDIFLTECNGTRILDYDGDGDKDVLADCPTMVPCSECPECQADTSLPVQIGSEYYCAQYPSRWSLMRNDLDALDPRWTALSGWIDDPTYLGDGNDLWIGNLEDDCGGNHPDIFVKGGLYRNTGEVFHYEAHPDFLAAEGQGEWRVFPVELDGDCDTDFIISRTESPCYVGPWGAEDCDWLNHLLVNRFGEDPQFVSVDFPDFDFETVKSGDLNGDGRPDLVFAAPHQQYGSIYFGSRKKAPNRVYLQNESGGFYDATADLFLTPITADASSGVNLEDVDGDNDLDMVFSNYLEPSRLYLNHILPKSGNPSPDPYAGKFEDATSKIISQELTDGVYQSTQSIAIGDVNGDGKKDFIFGNEFLEGGPILIYLQVPNVPLTLEDKTLGLLPEPIGTASGSAVGDVDLDGSLDLLIVNGFASAGDPPSPSQLLLNRLNGPEGAFIQADELAFPSNPDFGRDAVLEDFDGDGDLDIFIANHGTRNRLYINTLIIFGVNTGVLHFEDMTEVFLPDDTDGSVLVYAADIDGNGPKDLIVINDTGAGGISQYSTKLYFNDLKGSWRFWDDTDRLPGGPGELYLPQDLDGDGLPELVGFNGVPNSQGDGYHLRLYKNLGNWKFSDLSGNIQNPGFGRITFPAFGDLDNDGDLDFGVFFQDDGFENPIWFRNTFSETNPHQLGFEPVTGRFPEMCPECLPLVTRMGDVNLDGKTDIFLSSFIGVSYLLLNEGQGYFEIAPQSVLPVEMTLSLVALDAEITDFNKDGMPDIFFTNLVGYNQILINKAKNRAFISVNTPLILSAQDDLSGISGIYYRIDQGSWQPVQISNYEFHLSQEGQINLSYYATDLAGNISAVKSSEFSGDNTPPSVQMVLPEYTTINVPVTLNITDSNGSDGGYKYFITEDSAYTPVPADFVSLPPALVYSLQSSAEDQTLYVWVKDCLGNPSIQAQASTVLDTTAPTVSFTPGLDGACTNNSSLAISGTVSDDNPISLVKVNGVVAQFIGLPPGSSCPPSAPCSFSVPLSSICDPQSAICNVDITVEATDAAGNVGTSDPITVYLDTIPPLVNGFNILGNLITNSRLVGINIDSSDVGCGINRWLITETSYAPNGQPPQPTPEQFVWSAEPSEYILSDYQMDDGIGDHYLYAWVMDAAGNISSYAYDSSHPTHDTVIFYDPYPPSLVNIYLPPCARQSFNIVFQGLDNNYGSGLQYFCIQEAGNASQEFCTDISGIQPLGVGWYNIAYTFDSGMQGSYFISAYLKDFGTNRSNVITVPITIDNVVATVEEFALGTGTNDPTNQRTINVKIKVRDDFACGSSRWGISDGPSGPISWGYVTGDPLSEQEYSYSFQIPVAEGLHNLYAYAMDQAGNWTGFPSNSLSITTDFTPPNMVSKKPNINFSDTQNVDLTLTLDDLTGISDAFILQNGSEILRQASKTLIKRVDLSNGEEYQLSIHNYFKLIATDLAGNTKSYNFTLNYKQPYVPGEVIAKFVFGTSQSQIQNILTELGGNIRDKIKSFDLYLINLPTNMSVPNAINILKTKPEVLIACGDPILNTNQNPPQDRIQLSSNPGKDLSIPFMNMDGDSVSNPDEVFSYPRKTNAFHLIHAAEAWGIAQGSNDVIISVLDSGVDLNHPDLQANIYNNTLDPPGDSNSDGNPDDDFSGCIDDIHGCTIVNDNGDLLQDPLNYQGNGYVYFNGNFQDKIGHGTSVAGLIAGVWNNGGIAGLNENVKILPIRIFGYEELDYFWAIARGIDYAIRMGANIISHSGGAPQYAFEYAGNDALNLLQTVMNRVEEEEILFVAAAGNGEWYFDTNGSYIFTRVDNTNSIVNVDSSQYTGTTQIDLRSLPASLPNTNIISVGALDITEGGSLRSANDDIFNLASFSNYGISNNDTGVDIAAPGAPGLFTTILPMHCTGYSYLGDCIKWDQYGYCTERERLWYPGSDLDRFDLNRNGILYNVTDINNDVCNVDSGEIYADFGGTSAAAPLVAGAAGLVLSIRPDLLPANRLKNAILSLTGVPTNIDSNLHNQILGNGRVLNVYNIINQLPSIPVYDYSPNNYYIVNQGSQDISILKRGNINVKERGRIPVPGVKALAVDRKNARLLTYSEDKVDSLISTRISAYDLTLNRNELIDSFTLGLLKPEGDIAINFMNGVFYVAGRLGNWPFIASYNLDSLSDNGYERLFNINARINDFEIFDGKLAVAFESLETGGTHKILLLDPINLSTLFEIPVTVPPFSMAPGAIFLPYPTKRLFVTSLNEGQVFLITKNILGGGYSLDSIFNSVWTFDIDYLAMSNGLKFFFSSNIDPIGAMFAYDTTLSTVTNEDYYLQPNNMGAIKADPLGFLYVAEPNSNQVLVFSGFNELTGAINFENLGVMSVTVGNGPGTNPNSIDLSFPCGGEYENCFTTGQN